MIKPRIHYKFLVDVASVSVTNYHADSNPK